MPFGQEYENEDTIIARQIAKEHAVQRELSDRVEKLIIFMGDDNLFLETYGYSCIPVNLERPRNVLGIRQENKFYSTDYPIDSIEERGIIGIINAVPVREDSTTVYYGLPVERGN